MGLGYVEGVTHNYVRHGMTMLFAALNLATGTVIGRCQRRHRHQEYLRFLKEIDANVPKGLAVHLIVDNYVTHKHPGVQRWLAAHHRVQVHCTPTYASWLNQVEIWFHIIIQKAIRRGTFGSVKELVAQIEHFV
jgi:putative transposase